MFSSWWGGQDTSTTSESPTNVQTGGEDSSSSRAGRVGLQNLGNTCFMNAGLQCLSHIEALSDHFLSGDYEEDINTTNALGSGGELARAFADLQRMLWESKDTSRNPRQLHKKLSRLAPHLFEGYEQQDVQEFLAFCLDGLHEDVNRVTKRPTVRTTEEEEKDERMATQKGEEFAAALSWLRYLERGKSFLVDLLQGQQRSSLTCSVCGHKSTRFEPFLYLSLPVNSRMRTVTDALSKYLEEEALTGDEQWFCEKCNQRVDARKKIDLWKLPPVLVVHLKRFEFDMETFNFRKIDVLLASPEIIDLTTYCSSAQKDGATYSLTCVANHLGPFGSGHYTATCRVGSGETGAWHYFDDERVYPLDAGRDPLDKGAYVLFFVRNEPESTTAIGSRGSPHRQTLAMPQNWPHFASARNSVVMDLISGAAGAEAAAAVAAAAVASNMVVAEEDHEISVEERLPHLQSSPGLMMPSQGGTPVPLSGATLPGKASSNSQDSQKILEGWLWKRGPVISLGWSQRWCVLGSTALEYYEDERIEKKCGPDIQLSASARAVSFVTRGAPGDAIKHFRERPCGFVLDPTPSDGPKRHLFYFDAENNGQLDMWTQAIRRAVSDT